MLVPVWRVSDLRTVFSKSQFHKQVWVVVWFCPAAKVRSSSQTLGKREGVGEGVSQCSPLIALSLTNGEVERHDYGLWTHFAPDKDQPLALFFRTKMPQHTENAVKIPQVNFSKAQLA